MSSNRKDQLAQEQRNKREQREMAKAKSRGETRSYIDSDGCEVTVTPTGHVFYNASDWW